MVSTDNALTAINRYKELYFNQDIISIYKSYQTRIAMGFIKLLIYTGLIFTTATVSCIDEDMGKNVSERVTVDCSPDNIAPVHYSIILIPYTEESEFIFSGECNVTIKICYATLNISLHLGKLQINKMATTLINNNGTMYKPTTHNYHNETFIMDLIFDNGLLPGFYVLYVTYASSNVSADQETEIFYTDKEGYKLWLAMTPYPSVAVRRVPRCFDDPALRPTYNISIKHYQKYKALSNMPIREKNIDADGMIWSHFRWHDLVSPPMTSCTPIVVVLNFDRVPNAKKSVNMWCRSNFISQVQFAQNVVEKVVQHMIRYTNIPVIIPKTDHIAIPNLQFFQGLSNWGLIIYNERSITYDDSEHDATRKRKVAELIAHEMIHYWFGDLVSISSWSEEWLIEGFASFFSPYILNKIFEDWHTMDFLVIERLHGSLRTDSYSKMESLNPGKRMPPDVNTVASAFYDKAPVIIRMLQHITTEKVFQKGINIFLSKHQFKLVSSDDLWISMQTALHESDVPHKDFQVKEVMDPWLNQTHHPLVTVTRNYETGEVIISQEHFRTNEIRKDNVTDDNKWWIPITFTTQTNPDFTNTVLNFRWLSPKDGNIRFEINPNDWIVLNLQQIGYYRVNYDTTNWQRLANYLNSDEYTKIHVLNRAQLIDDAFYLVIKKKLNFSIFLNISNYLSRDRDYIAWYPMFHIIPRLSTAFSLPEAKTVKAQVARIFDGLLENVGSEEDPNENDIMKLKRHSTLYWACHLGNPVCQRMANIKLDQYLANSDNHTLSSFWHEWIYCSGLMAANRTTWNKVLNLFEQNHAENLLKYLACSENPDIIINYLNISSSNNSLMQEKEHKLAFSFIVQKHARNNLVLDYILENLERVKPKLHSSDYALREVILSVFSKKDLDKIQEFVKNNINKDLASVQRAIEERWIKLQFYVNIFFEQFRSIENQT